MARLSSILDGVPSEIRILKNRGGTDPAMLHHANLIREHRRRKAVRH